MPPILQLWATLQKRLQKRPGMPVLASPSLQRLSIKPPLHQGGLYFFHMKCTMGKNATSHEQSRDKRQNRRVEEEESDQLLQQERRLSYRRDSTTANENAPPHRPPSRLRFNSLTTSNYKPYPPVTVSTRQPRPKKLNAENKDSLSFLSRIIENLKEGIL